MDYCFVCGQTLGFLPYQGNLREARCRHCGASWRNSAVARVLVALFAQPSADHSSLVQILPALRNLRIFEAQAFGVLHDYLAALPFYTCSEYLDEVQPGRVVSGVRCENLERLTFGTSTFDVVITQDVLEHVPRPEAALREIRRVLRPGGLHVFTVPCHPKYQGITRAVRVRGSVEHLLPPVFHGDPLRPEGCLVYTDFGSDLPERLQRFGMPTQVVAVDQWYEPQEVTWIGDDRSYAEYRAAQEAGDLLPFFKYNAPVFVSENLKLDPNDERYVPEAEGETGYEHLHRYLAASALAAGKAVLDIASGEGYGSALLAETARSVVGVDLSAEVVSHAQRRYSHVSNLEYRQGSCEAIPCDSSSVDLVVSFETIEHTEEHDAFLREVGRVLKPGGLLLLSSPNKAVYADQSGLSNPFHKRELYREELDACLHRFFPVVRMWGQRLTFSSYLWPIAGKPEQSGLATATVPTYEPAYFLALCGEREDDLPALPAVYTASSDCLYHNYRSLELEVDKLRRSAAARVRNVARADR